MTDLVGFVQHNNTAKGMLNWEWDKEFYVILDNGSKSGNMRLRPNAGLSIGPSVYQH